MDTRMRAEKDIAKLIKILEVFRSYGFERKYPEVWEYAENYASDARHFYEQGDYFTSFGAANYAYGFIDAVLVIEGKKDEHIL
ncbi:DUF357 domain-containing protein [Candidatus Micrarchaeota archaeon]|nr:DUF357 domain-containing protein [Candidatus Micrarchaeota archaeon]